MVKQGIVDCILADGRVTVTPLGGGIVSPPLTVPDSLDGILNVGTAVWYVAEGNTGIVLHRADGAQV